MSRSLRFYQMLERVIGRSRLYRVGRFLYLGARRELMNDPSINGEYALQNWILESYAKTECSEPVNQAAASNFLDVGANLGDWSAALLNAINLQKTVQRIAVHAFEPAPEQANSVESRFECLATTQSFVLCRQAVGASEGTAKFVVTGSKSGNSSIRTEKSSAGGIEIEVHVTTIDAYSAAADIQEIELLKIDTEGNDFNVIVGASEMLDRGRIAVVQFEYNWRWIDFGHCLKSVFEFIDNRPYLLGKLTQSRVEVIENWHPEMDRFIETNYVLVRRDFLPKLPHSWMQFDNSNLPVFKSLG